jgi:hypothetical protein
MGRSAIPRDVGCLEKEEAPMKLVRRLNEKGQETPTMANTCGASDCDVMQLTAREAQCMNKRIGRAIGQAVH